MIILVCGSRDWNNVELILEHILRLSPLKLIHGGCSGADSICGEIAKELGIEVQEFKADWKSHGRAAGPIRNQKMLDEGKPELVLAFHNDIESSRGTKDMVRRSQKCGVQVEVISEIGRFGFV